jgi:uncharacterized protein
MCSIKNKLVLTLPEAKMTEKIKATAYKLLKNDKSGHGVEHVERVLKLALKFAKAEGANKEIVELAVLLHDVDDYKIFGTKNAENLTNAKEIMAEFNISADVREPVLNIIKTMGYSKSLKGIRPTSLEGRVVSDADMCDAIGASGIIRSITYAVSDKGGGVIFDRHIYPNVNITSKEYNSSGTTHATDNAINHFFEKLLKLSNLMMTESGRKESVKRQRIMIDFLKHFFREEDAPDWAKFLKEYNKTTLN